MVKRENPLTAEQQQLVENHMYLVDAVIKTRIQINENVLGLGYEDLRQEGFILLCRAVQTHNPEIAKLTTYANKVIYNGLISHCRKINRQEAYIAPISLSENPERLDTKQNDLFIQCSAELAVENLLTAYAKEYTGVTRLGIEAILKKTKGMGVSEIARLYGVPPSYVGAWVSRAANKLRQNELFLKDIA